MTQNTQTTAVWVESVLETELNLIPLMVGVDADSADIGGMDAASRIIAVRIDRLTAARETARILKREAEKEQAMKPLEPQPIRRRADQLEAEIAAFLALRPDATPNEVKRVTGIEHGRVLRSEAWAMTHMSRKEGG